MCSRGLYLTAYINNIWVFILIAAYKEWFPIGNIKHFPLSSKEFVNWSSLTSIPSVIDVSIQSRQMVLVSLIFLIDCPEKMFSLGDVRKILLYLEDTMWPDSRWKVLLSKGACSSKDMSTVSRFKHLSNVVTSGLCGSRYLTYHSIKYNSKGWSIVLSWKKNPCAIGSLEHFGWLS